MLKEVPSYIKNFTKSIQYAAADQVKDKMPETAEFIDTNRDIFKAVYAATTHSKQTISYGMKAAQSSQVYKDVHVGINNILEDLKSGKFYNKEREAQSTDQISNNLLGDLNFDTPDVNMDDLGNFDDFDDFDSDDNETESVIEKSNRKTAEVVSSSVARTGKAIIEGNIASTNLQLAHQTQLFAGLRTSISGIHESVNTFSQASLELLHPLVENSKTYFEATTSIMQENNSILKEMLEMQRNLYKNEKEKESSRLSYSDVVSGGTLDFENYAKVIKNNLVDMTGGMGEMLTGNTMGEGSSLLSAMFAMPLAFIPNKIAKTIIPKKLIKNLSDLDNTISGIIPTLFSKMAKADDDIDGGGIFSFISKLFGFKDSLKSDIDTSNYVKTRVPFDGITRKAIVDVIPEHLSRIESLLSGQSQRIYNYDTGKWTNANKLKESYDKEMKDFALDSFRSLTREVSKYIEALKDTKTLSYEEYKSMQEDVENDFVKMYKDGAVANFNDPEGNGLSDTLNQIIKAMPKHKVMQIANGIYKGRESQTKRMNEYEKSGNSIYSKLFDESNLDSHIKYDSTYKDIITSTNSPVLLNNVKDEFGNTIFKYLYNIDKKLSYLGYTAEGRSKRHYKKSVVSLDEFMKQNKSTIKINPEILKRDKDKDNERESWNKRNRDFKASEIDDIDYFYKNLKVEDDSDFDEFDTNFNKSLREKHENLADEVDKIPGNTMLEKFKNAETYKERFAVLRVGINELAQKPVMFMNDMIVKAQDKIYNFLFEQETETTDKTTGEKIKGKFHEIAYTISSKLDELGAKIDEKIIEPIIKKFGLEDKFSRYAGTVSDKLFGKKEKDANGNYIKNENGFVKREKGLFGDILTELQSNYNYSKEFVKKQFSSAKDDIVNSTKSSKRKKNYELKKIEKMREEALKKFAENNIDIFGMNFDDIPINSLDNETREKIFQNISKSKNRNYMENLSRKYTNGNIQSNARGINLVKKSGLTAISEGEAIIPAELNPFNPNRDKVDKQKEIRNENKIKNDFAKTIADRILTNSEGSDFINFNYDQKKKEIENKKFEDGSLYKFGASVVDAGKDIGKTYFDKFSKIFNNSKNKKDDENQDKEIEKDKETLKKVVIEESGNFLGNASSIIAKTIIGSGVGLLSGVVGGPLIGGAIGTAYGMMKTSGKLQDFLFGKVIDDKGGREGGHLLSKKTQEALKRYVPDMTKFGILGGISSLITPLGPIAGILVGSAIGAAKNSTRMQEMLFGEDGLINKEKQEKIKKAFPYATAGAIAGLFLGPFGMVGNAALGAGLGLITTSDEFKDVIFGEEDASGDRFGGLVGSIKDNIINPLKEFGMSFKDNFFDVIEKNMINPLKDAIDPLTKEIAFQTKRLVLGLPKTIANIFRDTIGTPIADKIGEWLNPVSKITRKVFGKAMKLTTNTIFAPFKIIGGLGNKVKMHQIRQGRAGGSAAERLSFREDHKSFFDRFRKEDKYAKTDKALYSMDEESLNTARDALASISGKDGLAYYDKNIKNAKREVYTSVNKYFTDNKIPFKGNIKKYILRYIENGEFDKAIRLAKESKTRDGKQLSKEEFDKFSRMVSNSGNKYHDLISKRNNIEKMMAGGDVDKEKISAKLKSMGIDISSRTDLSKMLSMFDDEISARKLPTETKEKTAQDQVIDANKENTNNIIDALNSIREAVENIGLTPEQKKAKARANRKKSKTVKDINKEYDANRKQREKVLKSIYGEDSEILNNRKFQEFVYDDDNNFNWIKNLADKQGFKFDNKSFETYNSIKNNSTISRKRYHKDMNVLNQMSKKNLLKYGNKFVTSDKDMQKIDKFRKAGLDLEQNGVYSKLSNLKKYNNRLNNVKKLSKLGKLDTANGITSLEALTMPDVSIKALIKSYESKPKTTSSFNPPMVIPNGKNELMPMEKSSNTILRDTKDGLREFSYNNKGELYQTKSKINAIADAEDAEDDATANTIKEGITSIKDKLFTIFDPKKRETKDKKDPLWKRLLDSPVAKAAGGVMTVGAALFGVGKLKSMWDDESENGIMHRIANKIGSVIKPIGENIKDWFAGEGKYKGGGFPHWIETGFIPHLFGGIDFIIGTIIPKSVEAIIKSLPALGSAIVSGIGSLFGIGNKHKNDNKGRLKDIKGNASSASSDGSFSIGGQYTEKAAKLFSKSSSSPISYDFTSVVDAANQISGGSNLEPNQASYNGKALYKKDENGNLVAASADEINNLDSFYTESGAEYKVDKENGTFESVKGDTANNKTIPQKVKHLYKRSALTGRKVTSLKGIGTTIEKAGFKRTGKFAKSVFGTVDNISNVGAKSNKYLAKGLKAIGNGESIKSVAGKAMKTVTNVAKKSDNKIIVWVRTVLEKIFGNKHIQEKIAKSAAETGAKLGSNVIKELIDKLIKEFSQSVLGKTSKAVIVKLSAKAGAAVSSAGIINGALAINDFITGFDNARAILGVDEVSFSERLIAGLANALNEFALFGVIETSTVVNWIAPIVMHIFGKDIAEFRKRQEEADKIVEQYNFENGTNISKDEYYRKQTFTGKIQLGFRGLVNNTKKTIGKVTGKVGKVVGKVGSAVSDFTHGAIDKTKEAISSTGQAIGNIYNNIKNSKAMDNVKYVGLVIKDKINEAVQNKSIETEGMRVSEDDPDYETKKTLYYLGGIISTPITALINFYQGARDFFKDVIKGFSQISVGVGKSISSMIVKSWDGNFSEAFNDDSVDTKSGNPIIDNTSKFINSVTKTLMFIPGLVSSASGFLVRGIKSFIDGTKIVFDSAHNTARNIAEKSWSGNLLEAFNDNSYDAHTGNEFTDNASKISNSVTKTALFIPGLVASGVGTICRSLVPVINGISQVGSSIGATTGAIFDKATEGSDPTSALLSDEYDAHTGNQFVDISSKLINSIVKVPLAPIAYVTSGISWTAKKITNLVDSFSTIGELSEADKKILSDSKDNKINPFSGKYWKINNSHDGIAGFMYSFNSVMQKIFNLPSALLAMINPKNWLKNGFETLGKKLGLDSSEMTKESDDKKKKKKGKGSGKFKGFVSQLDPEYSTQRLGNENVASAGCAPATATNLLNYYAGRGSTMTDATKSAQRYQSSDGGVTPEFFESYLGSRGINTYPTMSKSEMMNGIATGQPTILLGSDPTNRSNTPYGAASSHYVLATGLDGHGNVIVQDPESRQPNSLYPAKDLINQSHFGMVTGRGTRMNKIRGKLDSKLRKIGYGRGDHSKTVDQDLATFSPLTDDQIDQFIKRTSPGSPFTGAAINRASKASGLDPRYILAHAAVESGWGKSHMSHNYFGIGAYDSNPENGHKYGNSSMESGLINGAKWIRRNYYNAGQKTLRQMRYNNGHHEYCTSNTWMDTIASIMDSMEANTNASYHESSAADTSSENGSPKTVFDVIGNMANPIKEKMDKLNPVYDALSNAATSAIGSNVASAIFGVGNESSNSSTDGISIDPSAPASARGKQFFQKYNGKPVDYDGAYGSQCVDLFQQYTHDYYGKYSPIGGSGGAREIASRLSEMGYDKFYDKVNISQAQYGDWLIWDAYSMGSEYGHVAMFVSFDGSDRVKAFGTNQGGSGANIVSLPKKGIIAVLRPRSSGGKGSKKNKSVVKHLSTKSNRPILNPFTGKGNPLDVKPSNSVHHQLPNVSRSIQSTNTSYGKPNDAELNRLLSVIIETLVTIAGNTDKLSQVVDLLSKAVGIDESSNKSPEAKKDIKNKLVSALRNNGGSVNGLGNILNNTDTSKLVNAMTAIARA